MLYTLMNKNTELIDIEMTNGIIYKAKNFRTENKALLPVFLQGKNKDNIEIEKIAKWWQSRRIPANRDGIKELFFYLNDISLDALAEKSLGLSLSDQYWIRPPRDMISKDINWEDVNFFQNEFSEDIGELLIGGQWNGKSLVSPDNSSDGALKKRWKIIGGTRCLIKGSSDPFYQTEPFREVFASRVAGLLFDADFRVEYDFVWDHGDKTGKKVYSLCENFITPDTEYVPFAQFCDIKSAAYDPGNFDVCKKICGDYKHILDLILILDYIVLNEDRHFGNFGMIRSANTGELIRPAPVFDTGSSLFCNRVALDSGLVRAKPFCKDFDEQIKLVKVSDYRKNILSVKDKISEIFWETFADAFESESRLSEILEAAKSQIEKLLAR
ncbi:MAG: hypothetical protein FWH48_06985 [Oscillospiraceae bacterium]|nr:hypothetical protein [Oscillospiraceae bacterium]